MQNPEAIIVVTASELVEVGGELTELSTAAEGTGSAGNVQLQGREIRITGSAIVSSRSFSSGAGGTLTVTASELIELNADAGLFTTTAANGIAGNLSIETKNLTLRDGAQIASLASEEDIGRAGDVTVTATESIELLGGVEIEGEFFPSGLFAQGGDGDGGDLTVNSGKLLIQDGAQISAATFGAGNSGNLQIKAFTIELIGTAPNSNIPSGLFAQVERGARGDAQNLAVETNKITVLDGAQISTSARNGGQSGDLSITASDSILVSGTSPTATSAEGSSGIFASAIEAYEDDAGNLVITTADAGDLVINTGQLTVEKGAKISADNFGTGKSGNITLNIGQLTIQDGGLVGAGSLVEPIDVNVNLLPDGTPNQERGSGGTLTVNTTKFVEVIGTGTIGDDFVRSSLFTRAEGTGDAGNLNIFTPNLTVADGAEINVGATGSGAAGNLEVDASSILLDNGQLTANTIVGTGGNIFLDANNVFFRNGNGSLISTNAESTTGGNIFIDTDILIAQDNSDITANAQQGAGGRVEINAEGIFGIQAREQQTPKSDITATSELGVDFGGEVTLNTPDVDPTTGVVELPSTPIDAEALIAQTPCALDNGRIASGSSFTITGRGGLPPSADDPLVNTTRIVEWEPIERPTAQDESQSTEPASLVVLRDRPTPNRPPIQPIQGWVKAPDGTITLTASAPTATPQNPGLTHPHCRASN